MLFRSAFGFPAEFEAASDLAVRLEELMIYRLPDDYFTQYVSRVQAVTSAEVERAAATHIQPGKLAVVVVGDRKVIEPGIRALNLGPVRILSVEEAISR